MLSGTQIDPKEKGRKQKGGEGNRGVYTTAEKNFVNNQMISVIEQKGGLKQKLSYYREKKEVTCFVKQNLIPLNVTPLYLLGYTADP